MTPDQAHPTKGQPMADQTAPDVTDNERRLAREWAEAIEADPDHWGLQQRTAARVILDAVPAPTMAEMTPEERRACAWMQCDAGPGGRRGVITNAEDWHVYVVDKETGEHSNYSPDLVIPRPDLPRMEWPGNQKPAPAPALPEGWRLADHQKYGRVMVTTQTPGSDGNVFFVLPSDGPLGYDWLFCDHSELAYLDQGTDTADAVPESTLAVGSEWDDADALARACEETGRDQITVTDRNGDVSVWDGRRDDWRSRWPIPKYAPFTIIHAGRKADQ